MRQGAANDTVSYTYDAVGNFIHKGDFSRDHKTGWYNYGGSGGCGGGPNAVKRVQVIDGE